MRKRVHLFLISMLTIVSLTALAGCNAEEPVATGSPSGNTALTVPTFAQIEGAVTLDESDAAVVKAALGQWQQNARRAGGPNPTPGSCDRPHPMADFLARVAPSLDNDQLTKLVGFLAEHREQHMNAGRERRGHRHGGGEAMHARMAGELGLSADQVKAMDQLRDQTREKARELRRQYMDGNITEDQREEQLDALHAWHRAEFAKILTAEQLAKLDAMREQRREQRMERRGECLETMVERHAAWLVQALALTDEQATQVRATLSTCADNVAAVFAAGDLDRDQLRTRLRDQRKACEEALQAGLTAEQWERLQIMRRLHAGAGGFGLGGFGFGGPHGPGGPDEI